VAIPSVSRDVAPETLRAAARWVADQLAAMAAQARRIAASIGSRNTVQLG
jgi:hypothetical protein